MTKERTPLGPEDWLMAGFRALATEGPGALRAEALARALKTTKGSFYWHFADVADFQARMLDWWETRAFSDVVNRLDPRVGPQAMLRQLCAIVLSYRDPRHGGAALEPAMRAWGRGDAAVARAVERMDRRRIDFVAGLCRACGKPDPDLPRLLYAVLVGLESMGMAASPDDAERNVTATLGLLEEMGIVGAW